MSFSITMKIAAGKNEKVDLPNLAVKYCLVPNTITINQTLSNVTEPAKSIDVVVSTGNTQLIHASRALFDLSNVVDLSNKNHYLGEGKNVTMSVSNRHREAVELTFNIEYKKNQGNMIYQNRYDTFDNVLKEVHSVGHITRLVMIFSWKVAGVRLLPIFNHDDSVEWIDGLELGESDENGVYALDLFDSGELANYSQYLNCMRLDVPKEHLFRGEDNEQNLTVSVIGFGFTN
jgi:hypothetical protein